MYHCYHSQHKQYYQYQSSMQALADYAELLTSIKKTTPGAANSPVVVFGGSYGGMLAAWMRIKYPHVVQGWVGLNGVRRRELVFSQGKVKYIYL